jgi:hypothetical protein
VDIIGGELGIAEPPRRRLMAQYALPDLRYDYGALEPHILREDSGAASRQAPPRLRQRGERHAGSKEVAEALLAGGGLWNILVLAARATVLLSAGRACAPALYDRLARLRSFTGSEHERWALRQAYALAPP